MKAIILYYSTYGTTEALAMQIQEDLRCNMIKILPEKDYGAYPVAIARVIKETILNEHTDYITDLPDLSEYDVILVGYPIWADKLPVFMADFLEDCELDGKTIIPFATSGSTKIKKTLPHLRSICGKETKIGLPFHQSKTSSDEYDAWIERVKSFLNKNGDYEETAIFEISEDILEPGADGDKYVPYEERTGNESIVYFTRDLSAEGLKKIYARVNGNMTGRVGVKLHTGEPHGPNIIPRPWVAALMEDMLADATIVETNTYYEGGRYTTQQHRETLEINGWNFAPVDIMDEDGIVMLPVENGKWCQEIAHGKNETDYDSLFVLTHFKGHTQGGFGGSNKNIGIGMADGRIGKAWIHTYPGSDDQWSIGKEEFMERMTESAKATVDYFGKNITFVNVLRNMSVSCDCEGLAAAPVVTPNIGILASTDILAIDQASIDLVYALEEDDHKDLVKRIESRHGLRQLSYMKELGMGNDKYILIDIDNDDVRILPKDGVKHVVPFE